MSSGSSHAGVPEEHVTTDDRSEDEMPELEQVPPREMPAPRPPPLPARLPPLDVGRKPTYLQRIRRGVHPASGLGEELLLPAYPAGMHAAAAGLERRTVQRELLESRNQVRQMRDELHRVSKENASMKLQLLEHDRTANGSAPRRSPTCESTQDSLHQQRIRELEEGLAHAQRQVQQSLAAAARDNASMQQPASRPRSALRKLFRMLDPDDATLQKLFAEMDTNQDGRVDRQEVEKCLSEHKVGATEAEIESLLKWMQMEGLDKIDLKTFKRALLTPTKVQQWVAGTSVEKLIANLLPVGTDDEPLAGVLAMSEADVNERLQAMVPDLAALLFDKIGALRRAVQKTREARENAQDGGSQSKFTNFEMKVGRSCGGMGDFKASITGRVGEPSPDVFKGMMEEHTQREDSNAQFETGNYKISTSPQAEWDLVDAAAQGRALPEWIKGERVPRVLKTLAQYRADNPAAVRAGLGDAEIYGLVLYTGPMFQVSS